MATCSLDLRTRLLAAYDAGEGTRDEVAHRFRVSLGLVKKLLQQRRRTGDIAPRHHYSGRKPKILAADRRALRALVRAQPDLTLAELRQQAGLACTLPAIHYVLKAMGLSYKKRRSGPASKAARTSKKRAARGGGARAASTWRGSSSSMKAGPRPT
jgi:transposase